MKSKLILIFVIVSVCSLLISTTYNVIQDGTGDFIAIQDGIDFCANSDTILVYPGIYFENLVIIEKYITIGSLYFTTGDESYISQTIIDGYQNNSVIRIESVPELYQIYISGFVIQNGIGYNYSNSYPSKRIGGGIYVSESQISVEKCFVQLNEATIAGGGIALSNSNMNLIGSDIRYNHSDNAAGGLLIGGESSSVSFSNEDLNSIYLNYAGVGSDIFITHGSPYQVIIVDTFTVIDPAEGYYFIYPSSGGAGFPLPNHFSVDIQHAYVEQVSYDLYVSPDGNNNNSGFSASDPLQSIAYALIKIRSDSLVHKTIRLADGVYSVSENNQYFPLHIKSYVDIVGESLDNTILNVALSEGHFIGMDPQIDYAIKDLTMTEASIPNLKLCENTGVFIDNVKITNGNFGDTAYSAFHMNFTDILINNLISENNLSGGSIYLYSPKYGTVSNVFNSIFRNNAPSAFACKQLFYYRTTVLEDSLIVNIINTEITDNIDNSYEWLPATSTILIDWNTKLNLVNCTIGNNETLEQGAAVQLRDNSVANIVNSILYGNMPYEICLDGFYGPCTLNAENSLIEGGVANILNLGNNIINWDEETMMDEDPLWLGPGADWPYALSANSSCIDAGTLDLPAGIELPEYDLAGNPRIYGDTIDMGAYEWQGVEAEDNEIFLTTQSTISNYPNPFNPSTTIKLELAESGKVELAIFNIKGQKVKTLMDCSTVRGIYECVWNGRNDLGKSVSSGQYVVKLQQNGKETATKIMLLK